MWTAGIYEYESRWKSFSQDLFKKLYGKIGKKQTNMKNTKKKRKSIFNWIFVCSFLYMPDIYTYSLADIFIETVN